MTFEKSMLVTNNRISEQQSTISQAKVRFNRIIYFLTSALIYSITSVVGLNGDLQRYGEVGLSLSCTQTSYVWGNYTAEPVFAGLLWILSLVWKTIYRGDPFSCGPFEVAHHLHFAVMFSLVVISAFIFLTRRLRWAIYLHILICTDSALSILPFNLVRQYAGLFFSTAALLSYLNGNRRLLAAIPLLIFAALCHWSYWLLVILLGFTYGFRKFILLESARKGNWRIVYFLFFSAWFLTTSFALIPESTFLRVMDKIEFYPQIWGIFRPSIAAQVVLSIAIYRVTQEWIARSLALGAVFFLVLAAMIGADPVISERMRAIFFPLSFCALLIESERHNLPIYGIAAILLSYSIGVFLYNDIVMQPFAGRQSFDALLRGF